MSKYRIEPDPDPLWREPDPDKRAALQEEGRRRHLAKLEEIQLEQRALARSAKRLTWWAWLCLIAALLNLGWATLRACGELP
jgi:hypothetical protein